MGRFILKQTPIVFFDLDGTLLTSNLEVAASSIEAIQRISQKGIMPVLATGRTLFEIDYVLETTGIRSCVLMNGQYVIYDGEVIYKNPLDTEKFSALHEAAEKNGHAMGFHTAKTIIATTDKSELLANDCVHCGRDFPSVDREFYLKEPIFQAELYCLEGEEAYYQENFPYFQFVRNSPFGCDVYPANTSKASGIKKLLELNNISTEYTYAFGDSFNDLEMFQLVQNSVAMGNAVEIIKKSAKYVTSSNDEAGIARGLRLCGLI